MMKNETNKSKRAVSVEKRVKQLKKTQIWPSVLLFFVSFMITAFSVAAILSAFYTILFQDKFEMALQKSRFITSSIERNFKLKNNYGDAMQFLIDEKQESAVAVLDGNNNLLGQYGEMTYRLSMDEESGFDEDYQLYPDMTSSNRLLTDQGGLSIDVKEYITSAFKNTETEDNTLVNSTIITEPYWFRIPFSDGNASALVRHELVVQRKDVVYMFGIAIGVLLAISIPLFFLFLFVISSAIRQRKLYRLVSLDSVTGGYNWFYFADRGYKELNRRRNAEKCYAVVHLTYGKYRNYCSFHGGKAGDLFLQQTNDFLTANLKKGELCAHISEADFALLLNVANKEDAENRVVKILHSLPEQMLNHHILFRAGVCMANPIAHEPTGKKSRRDVDISQLYHNAGIAKEAVSEAEESGILVFDDKMKQQQQWEHYVEENMEHALQMQEFHVYLQPKYNPVTKELSGAEALVRWINSVDGIVSPGRFIPIFEKNGFITKLDDYMITHVAELQTRWISEGRKVVPVSVNVSRAHFTRPELAEHICSLTDRYQLPHELLEIELTESAFFDDKEVLLKTVNALKAYGFYVSMDDFGAGYSSLNSLKELPLDVLKLDADFFRGQYEKDRGNIVVSEAIQLAKKLNMKIVAEGIEEQDQVEFLAGLGCDMIQGYYFAKPMPVDEYELKM